jgi:arylsulfatase A-like enzyme
MIESMDESVGRILKTLDYLKLSSNTLVFFTSDNGGLSAPEWKLKPVTSNAPLREGKGHVYEGGIREPLIVRGPGIRPGVVDIPVCSIDFYPTILNLTDVPDDPTHKPDGINFAGILKSRAAPLPRELYWNYPHYRNQLGRPAGAVRQGDYTLIEFYGNGHAEL